MDGNARTHVRIVFVRHGHPNYQEDRLTDLGRLQAEAAAIRVRNEGISRVFSSQMGRSVETARHIAAPLGLEVEQLEFMRELRWGSVDDEPLFQNGQPWFTVDDMVEKGQSLVSANWETEAPFRRSKVVASAREKGLEFDRLLLGFGLEREGEFYRVRETQERTFAMVSHAGASGAVLAHLFNLPFPLVCKTMSPNFTAVTVVRFEGQQDGLVSPKIELLNDARHIEGISGEVFFGN